MLSPQSSSQAPAFRRTIAASRNRACTDPTIIVADKPTGDLDAKVRGRDSLSFQNPFRTLSGSEFPTAGKNTLFLVPCRGDPFCPKSIFRHFSCLWLCSVFVASWPTKLKGGMGRSLLVIFVYCNYLLFKSVFPCALESLQETTKEIVGIHVLLTHSLFACDIPRRLLLRVSLARPPSAPLQF